MIARRIVAMVPLLFLVSVLVFSLVLAVPGDPAVTLAGENSSQEQIEEIRQNLGLGQGDHHRK